MNKILMLGLLSLSATLHADCGDLEIKIINESSHNCTFKNKIVYYGALADGSIPQTIPAKESAPPFFGHQDYAGVGVTIAYKCDEELVKFYSGQNYCSFLGGAGDIGGMPLDVSTLNLRYEIELGSMLTGRPGKIIWHIS